MAKTQTEADVMMTNANADAEAIASGPSQSLCQQESLLTIYFGHGQGKQHWRKQGRLHGSFCKPWLSVCIGRPRPFEPRFARTGIATGESDNGGKTLNERRELKSVQRRRRVYRMGGTNKQFRGKILRSIFIAFLVFQTSHRVGQGRGN